MAKMIVGVLLIEGLLVPFVQSRAADSFCAVTVLVNNAYGTPIPTGVATLRDKDEKVVDRVPIRQGVAKFCDFGFGNHSIQIGADSDCPVVTLRNIRIRFHREQVFHVVKDWCIEAGGSGNACILALRVQGADGKSFAAAEIVDEEWGPLGKTDSFGRKMLLLSEGKTTLNIAGPGSARKALTIECHPTQYLERLVVLDTRD